ncbi:non-homologous end joining protein Ku [Massilia horti]|uniref:Non-homologous end joining protein Ku n=1 Tax=Massilia horti TaxID=2562153 RepID=A0A4Y9T315_9BURK|nr:Ku protein [Massilia horti]TFW31899.1 Ku protein [Massilia horti]
MARSMWKGAISFGLVHIPIEMYPAVSDKGLDLTMLDRRDFSPVGFKRYNKGNGKEVPWDEIVKGFEYTNGEYVVLSDEDLRRANPEATQTIDILAFVDAEQVPVLYYDQPYYLAPGKGGDKVYSLLRETLKDTGKIGIARVVIRIKQHLAALEVVGETIVLHTLRYPDEIRDAGELKVPAPDAKNAAISDKELKMAKALVEGMSEDWQPEHYHDTYREDVMALIEKKVAANETKTITLPGKEEAAHAPSNVIDLVSLLQASLGKKGGAAAPAAEQEEEEEQPAPKARKRAAAAAKSSSASRTTAPAKTPTKTSAKAPARRKSAA